MLDKHEQWRALCDEHEVARATYFANSRILTDKYARVFQGDLGVTPMEHEITRARVAREKWEDVRRRMDEFIMNNI
ncbi:MAG: hypothetical protein MAG794_00085 [Gammaproteobacteria bacterium]|nr:hypothetical protein [Gammaproteobacteria bacterium]